MEEPAGEEPGVGRGLGWAAGKAKQPHFLVNIIYLIRRVVKRNLWVI